MDHTPGTVSKKQIRISDPTEIRQRASEFANRQVSIVLKDNTVFYGVLHDADNHRITLSNMRRRRVTLAVGDISELYTDLDA